MTSTLRSPKASVSKAATEAPTSPPPPYSVGESHPGLAGGRHLDDDVAHAVAEVRRVNLLGVEEDLLVLGQVVADERAHVGVLPVEECRQGRDVDDRLHVAAPARLTGRLAC